ncbi:MAG: hypothetical protein ACREYE_03725 [Gammaproteobacteria bacterium]
MKKPTALGISRFGGARNPHVFQYTLRFLRSGGTRPSFARDGFFTNSQAGGLFIGHRFDAAQFPAAASSQYRARRGPNEVGMARVVQIMRL